MPGEDQVGARHIHSIIRCMDQRLMGRNLRRIVMAGGELAESQRMQCADY